MEKYAPVPVHKRKSFKAYLLVVALIIMYFAISSPNVMTLGTFVLMLLFILVVSFLYLLYTSYRHPSDRYVRKSGV